MGFVDRVGGILVRPRATLTGVLAGEGGLGDVAILLVIKVLADQTPHLARAVLGVSTFGAGYALRGIIQAAATVLPDVLAILIGSVLLSLFAGGRRARPARELDLAACAWIPYLAGKLATALVYTALQRPPGSVERLVADGAAAAWAIAIWGLALLELRRARLAAVATGGAS